MPETRVDALTARAPVALMYHGFSRGRRADDPENLFVDAGRFEAQLSDLLERGWQPLDLDAHLAWRRTGRRPAHRSFLVTIDDGYTSVLDLALPVLERLDVPAVLYVPAELVGRTAQWLPHPAEEPLLDAEALRHLEQHPLVEIGVHGADHSDLREAGADELRRQVGDARARLQDHLAAPARSFAYPFGGHDAASRAAVAGAGFDVAFSVFDDAGDHAVSRIDVNAVDTRSSFRLKTGLPGYRRAWRALAGSGFVRRQVRALSTRVDEVRR